MLGVNRKGTASLFAKTGLALEIPKRTALDNVYGTKTGVYPAIILSWQLIQWNERLGSEKESGQGCTEGKS